MMGRPWAASARPTARNTGPAENCGSGRLVTITATMATGTSSAISAAMLWPADDHASERMPPPATEMTISATSSMTHSVCDMGKNHITACAPMRSSAASTSSIGTVRMPPATSLQRGAVETPAEIARHRERAELAEKRRQQHGHDDEAREPADDEAQSVEPDHEERAGERHEARCAERGLRDDETGIEGRHAPAGCKIVDGRACRTPWPQ